MARLPPRHDLPLEAICITIEKNLLEILRRAESRELRPVESPVYKLQPPFLPDRQATLGGRDTTKESERRRLSRRR